MNGNYINGRYAEFQQGSRWATGEEIRGEGVPVSLGEDRLAAGGMPLLADKKEVMDGLAAAQLQCTNDTFFPGMAQTLGIAVLQSMLECLPLKQCNVSSFVELCSEQNAEIMCEFSRLCKYTSPTAMNFRGIYSAAEKTRQSIEVSLHEMLKIFTANSRVLQMLSRSTFDIHAIGRKKTIVFLEIADEKPTFYPLVTMFIKQVYEILIEEASKETEKCLPLRVHLVLDEFCNLPRISNFGNMIAASRSRGILSTIAVQGERQLYQLYGDTAETIKGNCANWYYLFSRELPLLEELSRLSGDIKTAPGETRPLISVSELQRLAVGQALVFHGRLYPYLTFFPDISEYGLAFPKEEKTKKRIDRKEDIVDIFGLVDKIKDLDLHPFAEVRPLADLLA